MSTERPSRARRVPILWGIVVLGVILSFAGMPLPVEGQRVPEAEPRESAVWYGITLGGGGTRLTCDVCQPARDLGPSLTVSAGAYGAEHLRVGLEMSAWTHQEGNVRERMYGLGIVAHLTPSPRRGLYLLGGFGWSGYRAGDLSYDAPRVTVGAGWDVPAFGDWVVGNVVSLDGAGFAGLRNDGATVVRNVGLSQLRFAVQLRKQ